MVDTTSLRVPELDVRLAQKLQRELNPEEVLIWTGQPGRGGQAVGIIFVFLFGMVVAGFSAFWILSALGFPSAKHLPHSIIVWIFALFGIPFLLVGLGLMALPVFIMRRPRNTVYAITSHRVIVGRFGGRVPSVYSLKPADLGNIKESCNSNGSGSIYFNLPDADSGGGPVYNLSGERVVRPGSSGPPFQVDFLYIPAVREVFTLLQKLAQTASPPVGDSPLPSGDSSVPAGDQENVGGIG